MDGIIYSSVHLELTRKYKKQDGTPTNLTDLIYVNNEGSKSNVLMDVADCKVKATSIKYDMGMYNPDHFTIELLLTASKDTTMSMSAVASKLTGLKAKVYYVTDGSNKTTLADELIVYKATPSCTALGATTSMTVLLDIYSSDKLLELKKFSQTFTGLPLSQIINDNLSKFVPQTDNSAKASYTLTLGKNKQILDYDINHEVIQPYLVQYNETFRSMLNRTANRCGEFLYWHNGQLQLGLHKSDSSSINLDACVERLSLSTQPDSIFDSVMTVAETHRSGNAKADADKAGIVNYDLETGMPDFNETVGFSCGDRGYKGYKDERLYGETFGLKYNTNTNAGKDYDNVDQEKSDSMTYVIGKFLSSYAKSGFFIDFLSETATDIAVISYMDNLKKAGKKDKAKQGTNNKRFSSKDVGDTFGFEPSEQTNFGSLFDKKKFKGVKGSNYVEFDKMESNYKIAPFSTLRSCIVKPAHDLFDGQVLGNGFYSSIRAKGKKTSEQAIDITLRANAPSIGLGDRIMVNGSVYIITAIKGDYTTQLSITLHAIPSVYKYGTTDFYIPEPLPEQNRVMDGNCTAIVTDNDDPYGQGRVRVRFSWQGKPDFDKDLASLRPSCRKKALKDVYGSDSEDNYTNDKNSDLISRKGEISKLIVAKKLDDNKSMSAEAKLRLKPEDNDSFVIIYDDKTFKKLCLEAPKDYLEQIKKNPKLSFVPYKWSYIKYLENRMKAVDDKTEKYQQEEIKKKIQTEKKKDSTPWIRMASPLASQKSNIYLKPQVNDEVIVGFENGNPERPYVLGSLFNGSAKAPSATYAINGINGESITMEDEDMPLADLVGKLISPVAKTIMSSQNEKIKNALKDCKYPVGGKISLKDKYGFYSLSMSSADRKIDIKCPLGDVSISAFTGITLSAPNGDINIKGKNVNISAGDKVSIVSGTNKDIRMWSWWDGFGVLSKMAYNIASSAMKKFVGDYKVIDMGLERSMWEVFCRPLNGTLLLQSKHHLLLQAGNGVAEPPVDAISVSDACHANEVFPNYPYYLLNKFGTQVTKELESALVELNTSYKKVQEMVLNCRKDFDAAIDVEKGYPELEQYIEKFKALTEEQLASFQKLSKKKMLHVLKNCIVQKDKQSWKLASDDILYDGCPFPNVDACKPNIEYWKNLVLETAKEVCNFANCATKAMSIELFEQGSTATKAFIEAINNAFNAKKAGGFVIRISEKDLFDGLTWTNTKLSYKTNKETDGNIQFDWAVFYGADSVDLTKYDECSIFEKKTLRKERLFYNIIKVLHKQKFVYYVKDASKIRMGLKNYEVADLPEWDNVLIDFSEFLTHIMPAEMIEPTGKAKAGKIALDTLNTFLNDSFDFKNANWMFAQERTLWDARKHPGLILMSDEMGLTTTALNDEGKFTESPNNSLFGVLLNMGKKKPESADGGARKANLLPIAQRKRTNVDTFLKPNIDTLSDTKNKNNEK